MKLLKYLFCLFNRIYWKYEISIWLNLRNKEAILGSFTLLKLRNKEVRLSRFLGKKAILCRFSFEFCKSSAKGVNLPTQNLLVFKIGVILCWQIFKFCRFWGILGANFSTEKLHKIWHGASAPWMVRQRNGKLYRSNTLNFIVRITAKYSQKFLIGMMAKTNDWFLTRGSSVIMKMLIARVSVQNS